MALQQRLWSCTNGKTLMIQNRISQIVYPQNCKKLVNLRRKCIWVFKFSKSDKILEIGNFFYNYLQLHTHTRTYGHHSKKISRSALETKTQCINYHTLYCMPVLTLRWWWLQALTFDWPHLQCQSLGKAAIWIMKITGGSWSLDLEPRYII